MPNSNGNQTHRNFTPAQLYEITRDYHFKRYVDAFYSCCSEECECALENFFSVVVNEVLCKYSNAKEILIELAKVCVSNYNVDASDIAYEIDFYIDDEKQMENFIMWYTENYYEIFDGTLSDYVIA